MRASILVGIVVALHFGNAVAQDWGPRRDPFDRVVIAKYQSLLGRDPHDPGLAKLIDLYKRFRTLALLVTEYETKLAATPDDRALIVINGRLREAAGDRNGAIELYTRALAGNPGDGGTALRLGAALRAANRLVDARSVLEHTLEHGVVTGKPLRDVVRALADLSYMMRDPVAAAGYAIRLSDLDPTNPRAFIDRGDAMLKIGFPERAAESYANAERLLGNDTARKLDVIAARGRALEKPRPDDAEVEYRRAIALAPRGHYLREELFGRVVDLHRRANTMHTLLARTRWDWPEPERGVFEWTQLATLFDAVGDREQATSCLEKAVARSADARLHLQLADRYGTLDAKRAFAILGALADRMQRDVGVLTSVADRYARWGQLANAIATYEKAVKLDPEAEGHLLGLVESPLRAGDEVAARIALRNVASRLRKASTLGRLGEVLLEWGLYKEADEVYSRALKVEEKDPTIWRGRAATRDSLGEIPGAVADSERAIALTTDPKTRRQARKDLVRIVMHANPHRGGRGQFVDSWRESFNAEPADIDAGFLLLEYYQRSPCEGWHSSRNGCEREVITVLDRLSRIATVEFEDVISLATSHAAARRHQEAYEILHLLARIAPDRVAEIETHRAKISDWRNRPSARYHHRGRISRGYTLSWIDDPDDEIAAHRRHRLRKRYREAIAMPVRAGVKLGAGAGIRGDADHVVTVGVLAAARIARDLFITSRIDYTERETAVPVNALAMSIGIGSVIRTTRSTALVVGLAQRLERRFGDMIDEANLSRAGFSTDLTLDLIGRRIPLGVGARLEQGLSEDARSTALMFEVTLELR